MQEVNAETPVEIGFLFEIIVLEQEWKIVVQGFAFGVFGTNLYGLGGWGDYAPLTAGDEHSFRKVTISISAYFSCQRPIVFLASQKKPQDVACGFFSF